MRVLVVTSDVPFVEGGHRVIARSLVEALRRAGHRAEVFTTPQNRFGRQLSAYLATWLTDVQMAGDGRPIDRVVSLRYPAYAVRHSHHVVWLTHRMREYYDLWGAFRARAGPRGRVVDGVRRRLLHVLDRRLLGRCRAVYAMSGTIRDRLSRWGGIDAEVLYPPAPPRGYCCDGYDGSIFAAGRLTPLKRFDLLLRAAEVSAGDWDVRIAGTGNEEARLRDLVDELDLADRVSFLGHLDEEALLGEYARCSGVYFGPRQEDYGLVTVEAFSSSKGVVTCTDSGGPAELVRDGETGFVVEPAPEPVAGALDRIAGDVAVARRLGETARARAEEQSWSDVVRVLLGDDDGRTRGDGG